MQDQLISFETAKLAKEKGFNEYCSHNFDINGKFSGFTGYAIMRNYNKNSNIHLYDTDTEENINPDLLCTAPTQSLLQKWLREVHNLYVGIDLYHMQGEWIGPTYQYQIYKVYNAEKEREDDLDITGQPNCYHSENNSKTYEEALEIGLQEALKQINI